MPTTSSPNWSAPHNGLLGDASAIAGAASINQFLTTHPDTLIYQGNRILTPNGTGGAAFAYQLGNDDFSQPFTMSGTSIGRARVPVLPVGNGADLLVSLCQDNAGTPGTVITQTRIPASWITQTSVVAGIPTPTDATPAVNYTGNPLATAANSDWYMGAFISDTWGYPAASNGGVAAGNPQSAYCGNYFIQIGGTNPSSQLVADVFTVAYTGGTTIASAIPQPSTPVAMSNGTAVAITNNPAESTSTIVLAGSNTYGTTVYSTTFNPATGTISSWSAQASLPAGTAVAEGAAWGDFVYIVGGLASAGVYSNLLYFAQVQNGQITGWSTAKMPAALSEMYVGVCNGFLFVIGGLNSGGTQTATWYAALDPATGAPGSWIAGPPLPTAADVAPGDNCMPTPYGLVVRASGVIYALAVTEAGPAQTWSQRQLGGFADTALFSTGDGTWQYVELFGTSYQTATFYLAPYVSVPLPASGLTNGAPYHLLLQQQGGDLNNNLRLLSDHDVYAGNPTLLYSPRGAYSWQPRPSGFSVPLEVYDRTVPASVGPAWPLHLWEDSGARITTIVRASTPDGRVLGLLEAVQQSYAANSNTGFQTGLAPWTVTGGTAVQSSSKYFEGGFAAQVTPSGSASLVYLQSETLPCMPGQSITVEGRMWFTNAVTTAQASMSVNWYNASGGYLSTSSNSVTAPAATWQEFTNTFTAPASAYGYTVNPILGGTPSAAQVFYVDLARGYPTTTGPQFSTVATVNYAGTYPNPGQPLGTTQLA